MCSSDLRPEFLNRLDDVIIFHHLQKEDLKKVIELELGKVRVRLQERGLVLNLTDDAKEFIIKKGTDLDFGARPLRRSIERYVEDPLSEELLKGEFNGKQEIVVGAIRDDKGTLIRLDFQGIVRPDASAEPVSAASGDAEIGRAHV